MRAKEYMYIILSALGVVIILTLCAISIVWSVNHFGNQAQKQCQQQRGSWVERHDGNGLIANEYFTCEFK